MASSAAGRLLANLKSDWAAGKSAREIDVLLRSSCTGSTLLAAVADFVLLTSPSDDKSRVLDALAYRSMRASNARLRRFKPRSLWGVTPIVQLPCCAKADRLLGIESETLVFTTYYITSDFDINLKPQMDWICETCPDQLAAFQWMVLYWALLTYDIFHFFNDRGLLANVGGYGSDRFGISLEEMQILKRSGKRLYTYVYGADHRMREATLAMGKYNFCMACPEIGKFCVCNDVGGRMMLSTIGIYANAMIASGRAMELIPNARNMFHLIIDLSANKYRAIRSNSNDSSILRIAHAPNHGFFKGTQYLLDAVARLQARGVPVELIMLSGVPNEQVLELIASSDVLADQFISGAFGYTAIEGMALGVPVMCYLSPDVEFPERETLPIINCHPERIEEAILQLVKDKVSLPALGERSRAYVARNYSVEAFSVRLARLYLETGGFFWEAREALKRGGRVPTWLRLVSPLVAFRRYLVQKSASIKGTLASAKRKLASIRGKLARFSRYSVLRFRQLFLACGRWFLLGISTAILSLAIVIGRFLTYRRLRSGRPRSLWGVTPILTLPLLARCDRMLGIRSESVVFTTYHITKGFDVNFGKIIDWVVKNIPHAYPLCQRLILAWALLRYDIFHYFYDRGILTPADYRFGIHPEELEALKKANKNLYCYAYGADVRTRNETFSTLPKYNYCVDCAEPRRYCICDDQDGIRNTSAISRYAKAMLAMGDMTIYVPGCRDFSHWPIDIEHIDYVGVAYNSDRPIRIAHAPNHTHFKGTRFLNSAVKQLQDEGYRIELVTVSGVPNSEVLRLFKEADIIADQFMGGMYGYTAFEGMARGKPVLCYVARPEWLLASDECPLVMCDPESLYETLKNLIENPGLLEKIGKEGRRYIERHHSIAAVSERLGQLYIETACVPSQFRERLERRLGEVKTENRICIGSKTGAGGIVGT